MFGVLSASGRSPESHSGNFVCWLMAAKTKSPSVFSQKSVINILLLFIQTHWWKKIAKRTLSSPSYRSHGSFIVQSNLQYFSICYVLEGKSTLDCQAKCWTCISWPYQSKSLLIALHLSSRSLVEQEDEMAAFVNIHILLPGLLPQRTAIIWNCWPPTNVYGIFLPINIVCSKIGDEYMHFLSCQRWAMLNKLSIFVVGYLPLQLRNHYDLSRKDNFDMCLLR